jgi:peptidoglycan hydrolase CwlO-like protein
MTLQQIGNHIQDLVHDGNLSFKAEDIPGVSLHQLFNAILGTNELRFEAATISNGNGAPLIKGQTHLLHNDADLTLEFRETEGIIGYALTASMPNSWQIHTSFPFLEESFLAQLRLEKSVLHINATNSAELADIRLTTDLVDIGISGVTISIDPILGVYGVMGMVPKIKIPGLDWLAITAGQLIILQDPALGTINGGLEATLSLDNVDIDLLLQFPRRGTNWQLQGRFSAVELHDLTTISKLMGNEEVINSLPPQLVSSVESIQLKYMGVDFDPLAADIANITTRFEITGRWEPLPRKIIFENFDCQLSLENPLRDSRNVVAYFEGDLTLGQLETRIRADLADGFAVTTYMAQVTLSSLIEDLLDDLTLPTELPDLTLENVTMQLDMLNQQFSVTGQSADSLSWPIGENGLMLSDIGIDCRRLTETGGKTNGKLNGTLHLGGATLSCDADLPGQLVFQGEIPRFNLSTLLQELCGGNVVRETPIPTSILNIELTEIRFAINLTDRVFSLSANSSMGQIEVIVQKDSQGGWGFSMGFVPPSTWNFSTLDPALAVLNDLDFSGSTLIVSSSDNNSLALTTIELPNGGVGVQKGLNFFASLDTSALGMKELLPGFDLDSLQVYAAIGNNSQNMVIEAAIEGEFQIDKSTSFGDITFRLKPSPTDFELSLLGTVTTVIDESPLVFTGGLGVTSPPPAGRLQATMQGTWENPFGTQNLSISNVGLDLSMPPLSLGITGGLQIGDFEGRAAVSLNTANPTQSMLAVEFNELKLVDIFDAFCPPQVRQAIPRNLATTVLDVDFEDVKIQIVPQATTIGEVAFEQGITLQGRMNFWGLTADGFLNIDQGTGILVRGNMDPIILGNILKLTGAQGKPKATLLTDLRLGQPTNIVISGGIEVLGMSRDVDMIITDAGFTFTTTGKIFDLFEATLAVRGSDMANGDGIMVRATMKNDLFNYLSEKASATIEAAAKEAMREIADAQRAVNRAQTDVDQLNKSITAMRRTIEDERARDSKRLRDAQNAVQGEQNKVNSLNQQIANMRNTIQRERDRDAANLRKARQTVQGAQNKVNGLNSDITSMRRTVQTERDRDTANLRRAQTSVNNAQNEVNKIQRDINNTKSRITTINNEIAAKKRWLDARAWYEKVWAGPEYAAYESAKRIEQGALYTKLGGMEAAKHTALGILEAAKRSLRGMEQAAKSFPIDADPRVAALITARGTATAALNAAKATLGGLEKAAKTFPIDADPRMVGLFAARNTANGALAAAKLALKGIEAVIKIFPVDADPRMISLFTARDTAAAGLEVAKFTLEGVKQSVKGMAEVSQFIANGAGQLLIINEAMFESSLSAAHGGDVSLAVKLTFMNEPHDLAFDFDFHDPQQSAHALADLLLPG